MPQKRPYRTKTVGSGSNRPAPPLSEACDFPIVGIGASAGGLDACRKLIAVSPAATGMAFILVQHLDPTHESLLVGLLADHTAMTVRQATDGMPIARDHLYIIPPGAYLSVAQGVLHLSPPGARHGARLPFDFLLHSLAAECGPRAICVILSGSGADGSLGLHAVKEKGGIVIVQTPEEAGYDGMPRSALLTGMVDLVLPVARIPDALIQYGRRVDFGGNLDDAEPQGGPLAEIIALLHMKTAHDFTFYKPGTLQRRIERRMAISAVKADSMDIYLDILRRDAAELDHLAKDLLIHVTSFFRDPKVFDLLAEQIVPDLVRAHAADQPLRIWVAGCSTGEETYSLAMLFHECIAAEQRDIKLQVFASDVDPDAVAQAREGLYPETIAAEISPARLARFFTKEDKSYRVLPELRAVVVFTVQDILADPPFSRIDLVSCRNLLIYLRPEAQAKIVALFHFALRQGGILLLGSSETIGNADGKFEVISKSARLYRHIGRARPGEFGLFNALGSPRMPMRMAQGQAPLRQTALAELCRRLVIEAYAPAAVLINRKYECLYSMGPTDRYLRMAPGHSTLDLLSMAREGLRTKLRSAIQRAVQDSQRIVVAGGRIGHDAESGLFSMVVQPVPGHEELLLICFVDEPKRQTSHARAPTPAEIPQVEELQSELDATRMELQGAIRNLEMSNEEQQAINEEALSINEEFQSTNEELLTSKEELQSLNEELTALNTQLQETLERQRTTANDLQNVLYSTDVATLFLDTDLNIRFFTPATKALFRIIASDVGRPLADLNALAMDDALLSDAAAVLRNPTPIEREIEARSGIWYLRRILPYRTQNNGIDGVVITFSDITERRHAADALEAARRQAELATVAKSRFLATASHDLRQPLQTLALLHGLLWKKVVGEDAQKLVARLDETLGAMLGMLNVLLDINQIDAGTVHAETSEFPVAELLDRMRDEFTYHAQAQRLTLRVIPCGRTILSDPRLLEQILRNLLSNALKYTKRGKILLGCRGHGDRLRIEVWDTGIGIPEKHIDAIFEEYHQIDNAARERSRGLGLGLSIVQRLGHLLGHPISVRSWPGKGSVFAIDVPMPPRKAVSAFMPERAALHKSVVEGHARTGMILAVEDDPEARSLLELLLKGEGYHVTTASHGAAALDLVARGTIHPDLILADFNLPNGMDGLQLAVALREALGRPVPVIILTGDISTDTLRDVALQNCVQLHKPVKVKELTRLIQRLLPGTPATPMPQARETAGTPGSAVIFVVDDDSHVRAAMRDVLEEDGRTVEDFASCEAFLAAYRPGREACLLIDAYLPGMSGLALLHQLREAGDRLPAVMITGSSDVRMAVDAMKSGASDFIEKPIGRAELLACVARALEQSRDAGKLQAWRQSAADHMAALTPRQRQIMERVLAGQPSKNIAADLGISQRTVENHRASIMKKTDAKSLPALARLALAAAWRDD